MTARLTFLGLAGFWLAMNFLLWRAEYGSRAGDMPVPVELVWQRILTAPDASSLSVYQNHERTGYCEFSTSVGQSMAALEDDKLPPDGLVKRAGYQIHVAGNVAFGDFTNRLKFDGRVRFTNRRVWEEITCKISSHLAVVELHSFHTNNSVHVKIRGDGVSLDRDLTFAELQNPGVIARMFFGNFADALLGAVDLPLPPPDAAGQNIIWDARRTRVKLGAAQIPIYELESSALGYTVKMEVSTLGEILSVELPGKISARIDEWGSP